MKKLTLSAALLAFAMMGCSESGLDNSMASTTSEISNKQIAEYFKTVPTNFVDQSSSENVTALQKSGDGISGGFAVIYSPDRRYHITIGSNVFNKHDNEPNKGMGDISVFSLPSVGPNWCASDAYCAYMGEKYLHLYVACVRNCNENGFCLEHQMVKGATGNGPYYYYSVEAWCNELTSSNTSDIGVVTNAAAALDGGAVILQGASRMNLSNEMAARVYQNYILPQALADAGL